MKTLVEDEEVCFILLSWCNTVIIVLPIVYKFSTATDKVVMSVQLMNLLFSFLKPDHPHGTLSAGYFAKVLLYIHLLLEEKNSQIGLSNCNFLILVLIFEMIMFLLLLQVVICLMMRKTLPLVSYVQVCIVLLSAFFSFSFVPVFCLIHWSPLFVIHRAFTP